MIRLVLVVLVIGCRSSSVSTTAPDAVSDPFDPATNCQQYRLRAEPVLEAVMKVTARADRATTEQLRDDVRSIDKERSALGIEPFHERAREHFKATRATLDGIVAGLQGVAALRSGMPVSPESATAEDDLKRHLRALQGERDVIKKLCE